MSRTYKVTGINLKSQALGESDRILTILTPQLGLIRAIAPGARQPKSRLGGRSGVFVVNELLIGKGRSLDRIIQAETRKTYPGLAVDVRKFAAGQYLAEMVLYQALSEQNQEEIYQLLHKYLEELEVLDITDKFRIYAYLAHAVFRFCALEGLSPQVQECCLTNYTIKPNLTDPHWRVGFSVTAGGTVCLQAWENLRQEQEQPSPHESNSSYDRVVHREDIPVICSRLDATELAMLQYLSETEIITIDTTQNYRWLSIEQILRQYAQYHLGGPIRSATLIDSYFAVNHDATV